MASPASVVKLIPSRTAFLLCDLQTKFRTHFLPRTPSTDIFPPGPAIHGFDSLVATANKLFKAAKVRRDFTTDACLAYSPKN
jgi:hypothetical protein